MKQENYSMEQINLFKLRINEKSLIHQCLFKYLDISASENDQKMCKEETLEEIYQILKENIILTNKYEFYEFLKFISHLCEIYQSKGETMRNKIECLVKKMEIDIKNIFTEKEIFDVFRSKKNKFILLVLVEQNILSVETIIKNASLKENNDINIIKYFYPEIRKNDGKYFNKLMTKNERYGFKQFVKDNDQNLEKFYEIRKKGKKESKILELIREDKIEDFISFVEHTLIDLNQKIQSEESLFETDNFMLTPIEFSALYGSTKIFKYLFMKEANIGVIVGNNSNNIFKCAIQGRNYEIIHLLEERKEIKDVMNNQVNQEKYLEKSIKMHHNEIFEYFITSYNIHVTEVIIKLIINFQNYQLFNLLIERNQIELQNKEIISKIFCSFCQNGNEEIVKILVNQPNLDINLKNGIFHHLLI